MIQLSFRAALAALFLSCVAPAAAAVFHNTAAPLATAASLAGDDFAAVALSGITSVAPAWASEDDASASAGDAALLTPSAVALTDTPALVPEPASWILVGGGLGALGLALRAGRRAAMRPISRR